LEEIFFNHWVIVVEEYRKKTVFEAVHLLPYHC